MTKNIKAPNFKLESTSGEIIELNKIKSKYIVLYLIKVVLIFHFVKILDKQLLS